MTLTDTDLDGDFAGDVVDEEVHGDVLAVHVLVHHLLDVAWLRVRVHVAVVLQANIAVFACSAEN